MMATPVTSRKKLARTLMVVTFVTVLAGTGN